MIRFKDNHRIVRRQRPPVWVVKFWCWRRRDSASGGRYGELIVEARRCLTLDRRVAKERSRPERGNNKSAPTTNKVER
jgi:hypothetical protein